MFSPSCKIIPMSSRNIERPMDYIGYITIQVYFNFEMLSDM